jgi:hypothetical protein
MTAKTGKEMAEELTSFVNNFSADEKGFIDGVIYSHRTLQQSTGRLFIGLIKEWAKMESNGRYDGRNEAICKLSAKIVNLLGDDLYLPLI